MRTLGLTSESAQNYLKAIYQLDTNGEGATGQEIAAQVGVSGPGVTKMLRSLASHKLISYMPYQSVHLTELGEKIALEVIRHHRLLELYLTESLGYGWETVHAEAERLEHHISEEFEDTIERLLGYPAYDPHGSPIPTRDGKLPRRATEKLSAQKIGERVTVRQVTDEDPDLLRYLGERGLRPGVEVCITAAEPFGGSLQIQVASREERISPHAASHVFVERLEGAGS